jgi:hypothetical protein
MNGNIYIQPSSSSSSQEVFGMTELAVDGTPAAGKGQKGGISSLHCLEVALTPRPCACS